jgi:DNA-directed RNA polymerase subunit omega
LNTHVAEGITNPPIDELLTKADSKYRLVLFSAMRARQINGYYSQLGEGLLEYVGPLVETNPEEKPLTIALREINEGLLECREIDPEAEAQAREDALNSDVLRLPEQVAAYDGNFPFGDPEIG